MSARASTRVVVRVGRWLAGVAPEPLRSTLRDDGVWVLHSACADARSRGWRGFILMAWGEWMNVIRAGVLARLGRRAQITGGRVPSQDPHRRGRGGWIATDLRHAWRGLSASRGTVAMAVITLALGIGISASVFSVLDSILWRPVPYADADRLFEMMNMNSAKGFSYAGFSPELIARWQAETDLFDRVEAYDRASFVYRSPAGAEMVSVAIVSPGLLPMLGVAPARGRLFTAGDGQTATDRLAIVSDRFWRERLRNDPGVLGSTVSLNGIGFTIVGVMPASFRFPSDDRELWVPFDVAAIPAAPIVRPSRFVPLVRLQAGKSFENVDPQVRARGGRLNQATGRSADISARMMKPGQIGDGPTRRSLVVLGGAVAFLMLIVCANVANLALSRALTRTRDLALRAALGASRGDLLRQTLVEQALVGLLGLAGGLVVARLTLAAVVALLPESMVAHTLNAIDLDTRVLAVATALGALSVMCFGLPPALMASRAGTSDLLRSGSRSTTTGGVARRFRAALVVGEVAISMILLVGAAVLTRSLVKLEATNLGYDTSNLVSVTLGLPAAGYADAAARDQIAAAVAARLATMPEVTGTTIGGIPSDNSAINVGPIEVSDRPGERSAEQIIPLKEVAPNYFATLRLPILFGRAFTDHEDDASVILSESFARKLWPSASAALDRRFRFGDGPWRSVVGIAGDVPVFGEDPGQPQRLYYPIGPDTGSFKPTMSTSLIGDYRTVVVRTSRPATFIRALRGAVHTVDPSVVVWRADEVERLFAYAIARPRVIFLMMTVLAVFGLVLAAAGLHGVLSCLVTQRLREIGVRLAIGATASDVGRLVLGNGLALTLAGAAIGLGAALALVGVMRTLLYEVDPSDPLAVGIVLIVILVAAALSTWRPMRRAMRVDPVSLLRE